MKLNEPDPNKAAKSDALFMQQMEESERAFLNPDEWGLDLRPIIQEHLELPDTADSLKEDELANVLGWMVYLLAQYHICLTQTNHLSDRKLYSYILEKVLPEPVGVGPHPEGGIIYIEVCPFDDLKPWLTYYADDEQRKDWADQLEGPLPEKQPLVSDRDTWINMLAEAFRHEPLPEYVVDKE